MHAPKVKQCVHCGTTLQQSDVRCFSCGKTAFAVKNSKGIFSACLLFIFAGLPIAFGLNFASTLVAKNAQFQDKASYVSLAGIVIAGIFLCFAIAEVARYFLKKE